MIRVLAAERERVANGDTSITPFALVSRLLIVRALTAFSRMWMRPVSCCRCSSRM
jgi:hypothetical protein